LGPDDVLQIITRNHDEFSGKFIVDPYGKILIPTIGEIKAEDLTREKFTDVLREEISKYVQDPNVMVSIMQYRSKVVYILGEVRSPGKYPVEGDSIALRDAIAAAGFPTGLAATWRVYIIKPRTVRPTFKIVNLYKILYRGKMKNNVTLTPGDIVYVPATMLGKLSNSLSYLLDPFFKTRSLATPLSTPKPLLDETQ
jgi:polysaccharide export outer membrane protein